MLAESNPELVPLDILKNLIEKEDVYTQELIKEVLRMLIESNTHTELVMPLMKESMSREPIKRYDESNRAISNICTEICLQRSVKEHALKIYQDITKDTLLNREKHKDIIGVSIYVACQQSYVPRSIKEISVASGGSKSRINDLFRVLITKFKLQKVAFDFKKWTQHICMRLNLYDDISDKAGQILFTYDQEKSKITQKCYPQSVAAGAVYIAAILSGAHRTQKEIANVSGVSEVTIRKCYKELVGYLDIDVLL